MRLVPLIRPSSIRLMLYDLTEKTLVAGRLKTSVRSNLVAVGMI